MTGKITHVLPETVFESLDTPPHVLSQLTAMLLENWHPTPDELEALLPHLVECIYCQLALGTLITLELVSDPSTQDYKVLRKLLSRLTGIIHKTQTQEKLAAYIEILEAQGADEAQSKFPVLAEHLKHCNFCQDTIEGTRTLLRRAEQAGLIAPLAVQAYEPETDERG